MMSKIVFGIFGPLCSAGGFKWVECVTASKFFEAVSKLGHQVMCRVLLVLQNNSSF